MITLEERKRLAALHALDILDAPREPALDRIAHLVRMEFGARHAGIMMIDRTSAVFTARDNISTKVIPRDESFCNITIKGDDPLIIPDTRLDPRTSSNLHAIGGIRSYAGVPLRTRDGYNIGALCVFHTEVMNFPQSKIRKMKQLAKLAMDCIELRRLATQDHLTGAMNRRGFMAELDREIRNHTRWKAPLSLALMDLDHFKQINDRFGHPAGDKVLQSVVALAAGEWQEAEVIGRLGGEEFGILMPGHSEGSAFQMIERLRKSIEAIRIPSAPDLRVTASFGISEAGPQARASSALVANADTALYRAKGGSRNMTVLASGFPDGHHKRAH